MTWVRLDDSMPDHPKIADLSDHAFRLHVHGICYAARNLTDGYIPETVAKRLVPRSFRASKELVSCGIWEKNGNGFRIHDYTDYQPSASEIRALRAARREAGRRGGLARAQANAQANANPSATSQILPQTQTQTRLKASVSKVSPSDTPRGAREAPTPPDLDEQIRANLEPGIAHAIRELGRHLTDADHGTIGRLIHLAQNGAPEAAFHDARHALATMNPRPKHPSRYACHIIEQYTQENP